MSHYDSCKDPDQAYKDKMKFKPSKATKKYMKQALKNKTAILTTSKTKKSKKKLTTKQLAKLHKEEALKEITKLFNNLIKERLDVLYKVTTEELDLLMHYEPRDLAETIFQTIYTR